MKIVSLLKAISLSLSALLICVPCCDTSSAGPRESGNKPPNFVLILTDDLDLTLGGAQASTLQKTRQLIGSMGVTLTNWFSQTPVCCPSRAELLTGRMLHNIRKRDINSSGCMSVDVSEDLNSPFYSEYYFARFFSELMNYTVGVFGKHLNTKNPNACPPGVDRWLVNGGGDYLNPSFYWASKGVYPSIAHFNNCTDSPCYSTSVIGNASIDWIRDHVSATDSQQPFFAYVSVKAPHLQDGPGFPKAIPAPWYENSSIPEMKAPRTPNYNLSCPDHHWLVRNQPILTQLQGEEVDKLYQSRLKSLLSVDDLVEGMIQTLDELDVLDNTYIIFTSDNGFRLGQFRMPEAKFHPYENDIRLPMMIRGPKLQQGVTNPVLGSHVDVMPTLLGLASNVLDDSIIPATMDGSNLAGDLLPHTGSDRSDLKATLVQIDESRKLTNKEAFSRPPSSLLIEYMSLGNVVRYQHLMDTYNHTFLALRVLNDTPLPNIKYVEFRDSRIDWNFQGEALEAEFYNLDEDPYEMRNQIHEISSAYRQALHNKMMKMFRCHGNDCRTESRKGIYTSIMER
jgi:N-acetylglucosamine-6-sulfatase